MAKKSSSKTLKRGNIVWLISGSERLAVAGPPDKDGMVTVEWHDGKKDRTHIYHVDLLALAPPDGVPGKEFWAGLAKQLAQALPRMAVERRLQAAVDEGEVESNG